jgi:hypothetical protein
VQMLELAFESRYVAVFYACSETQGTRDPQLGLGLGMYPPATRLVNKFVPLCLRYHAPGAESKGDKY